MSETDLKLEAVRVCSYRATFTPVKGAASADDWEHYMAAIEDVLREKHEGATPQWMKDLKVAALGGDRKV